MADVKHEQSSENKLKNTINEQLKEIAKLESLVLNPYGDINISTPDEPRVYDAKFGNGKSTVVVNVVVPVRVLGMQIKAAVYARLETKPDGTEITIEPALAAKVFARMGEDFDGRGMFKSHVLEHCEKWAGWAKAEAAAMDRLSGVKPVKAASAKPDMPVRLVKKVTLATPQNDAAA